MTAMAMPLVMAELGGAPIAVPPLIAIVKTEPCGGPGRIDIAAAGPPLGPPLLLAALARQATLRATLPGCVALAKASPPEQLTT